MWWLSLLAIDIVGVVFAIVLVAKVDFVSIKDNSAAEDESGGEELETGAAAAATLAQLVSNVLLLVVIASVAATESTDGLVTAGCAASAEEELESEAIWRSDNSC
jgi:uncharacterized membrane protein YjgN (DUF898 family)